MSIFDEKFPNGIGAIDPVTHSTVVALCAVADEVRMLRTVIDDEFEVRRQRQVLDPVVAEIRALREAWQERNAQIDAENKEIDAANNEEMEAERQRRQQNESFMQEALAGQRLALGLMGKLPTPADIMNAPNPLSTGRPALGYWCPCGNHQHDENGCLVCDCKEVFKS